MSVFNERVITAIEKNLKRFETRRSAILPILHVIHDEFGYVSAAQVEELENTYSLPKMQVQEVITFYSRYQQQKPCRFHVQFCDNIVCRMFGSEKIIAKLRAMQVPAGSLSVAAVPCLGVCDRAPAMLVNSKRHLSVDAQKAEAIINGYLQQTEGVQDG